MNDTSLVLLLRERTSEIIPGNYYFRGADNMYHPVPGARYRAITLDDLDMVTPIMTTSAGWPFEVPDREALARWITSEEGRLLEDEDGVAGIGAILHGYNPTFASVGMVVMKRARRRSYGSYLIEELKREAYDMGKIPRADCDPRNTGFRATLLRAGFLVNARALRGSFADDPS
jgi:GNAT superfamily N-acetyltransferase